MALNLGSTAISNLRLGSQPVSKVMLGATQAWPVGSGQPWTPADLTGTDWEWYDYSQTGTITLSGSSITQINSLRSGGQRLFMDVASFQPVYEAAASGLPGRLRTSLNGFRGLYTDPIMTGTITAHAIANYEILSNTKPSVSGLSHIYQCGNQFSNWTSTDVGYGSNVFFNSFGDPNKWDIGDKRENGVYHPPGTQLASGPSPWRAVWSMAIPTVTLGPASNPRRICISGEIANANAWSGAGGINLDARIYEQIFWKSAPPTLADIQKVEGYMAWKPGNENLGLVALLAADHPYKNAPPTK